MSMFKKMKERITDEVNSATNKLQSMQLIDNLALTLGQTGTRNDHPISLPSNHHQATTSTTVITTNNSNNSSSNKTTHQPFSLLGDNPLDDEELNSELSSPQHLFNESAIPRKLNPKNNNKNGLYGEQAISDKSANNQNQSMGSSVHPDLALLDLSGSINSDLDSEASDDELTNGAHLDGMSTEIDLTSDNNNSILANHHISPHKLKKYRSKYKNLVNLYRQLLVKRDELNRVISDNHNRSLEKTIELKNQIKELNQQLQLLQTQQETRTQASQNLGFNNSFIQNDSKDSNSIAFTNSQQPEKSATKIRDLEVLLAKCKDSLKAKNVKIDQLEQNLKDYDSIKEENETLKSDLTKLRQQHEDWTVSVAESKRSVHEELETRTSQLNKITNDYNELSKRLLDTIASNKQQSVRITELEGQITKMNAAHEQEKVNQKKESEKIKNHALHQLAMEHERRIAQQKQELQKIIDDLRVDNIKKDECLKNSTNQIRILEEGTIKTKSQIDQLHTAHSKCGEEISKLRENLEADTQDLNQQIKDAEARYQSKCNELQKVLEELKAVESSNEELNQKIASLESTNSTQNDCQECQQLLLDIQHQAELSQQEIYELNSRLTLLSTATEDQEKEISTLRSERDSIKVANNSLKVEFEELIKKNESLNRVIHDTETDIQSQQEQLDELIMCKQELENFKKSQSSSSKELEQLNSTLSSKNSLIQKMQDEKKAILNDLQDAKAENEKLVKLSETLQAEKDKLTNDNYNLLKEFSYHNQSMVSKILNTMKNLETPGVSPASEDASAECSSDDQSSSIEDLPKSTILMEQLSRLAIDRCNAYVTATQRLEASITENKSLVIEAERLKEELDRLNSERKEYLASCTEETEQLREDNQALTNEWQSSQEKVEQLEEEISQLRSEMESLKNKTEDSKNAISNYETTLSDLKENQFQTESRIKDYLAQIEKLETFRVSYSKQIEQLSVEKASNLESIREFEKKIDTLSESYQAKCDEISSRINTYELKMSELKNSNNQTNSNNQSDIGKLEEMGNKLAELQMDILDKTEAFDAEKKYFTDTINDLKQELTVERNRTMSNDHNYQIGALQRVIQQYQEENQRLKELSRAASQQSSSPLPDPTEYEYLKNIVLQFMLGKEPLVLAKVISAVFRFEPDQIEQVVKTQESLQVILNSSKGTGPIERRR